MYGQVFLRQSKDNVLLPESRVLTAAAPRPASHRVRRRELPLPSAADFARHRQLQREAPPARPWSPPTTITIGPQGQITRFIPLIPHLAVSLHQLPGGQLGPVAAALRHAAEDLGLKGAQWLLYRVVDSRNPDTNTPSPWLAPFLLNGPA